MKKDNKIANFEEALNKVLGRARIPKELAEQALPALCLRYLSARKERDRWQSEMEKIKTLAFRLLDVLAGKNTPQIISFKIEGKIYKFGRIKYGEEFELDLAKAKELLTEEQLDAITVRKLDKKKWNQAIEAGIIPKSLAAKIIKKKDSSLRVYASEGEEPKEEALAPVLELPIKSGR